MSKESMEFLKKKGLSEPVNFGGYGGDKVAKLLDEYARQESRELREPIENALYATGRFTTDECTQLAEGIIQYIAESK